MAKVKKSRGMPKPDNSSDDANGAAFSLATDAMDPNLALLFSTSAGPVKPPSKSRYAGTSSVSHATKRSSNESDVSEEGEPHDGGSQDSGAILDVDLSSIDGDIEDIAVSHSDGESVSEHKEQDEDVKSSPEPQPEQFRKRKRTNVRDDSDLEGQYMLKIAREEEKEQADRELARTLKRQKVDPLVRTTISNTASDTISGFGGEASDGTVAASIQVPLHESLAPASKTTEVEKASRTVFLANVPTICITDKKCKKELLEHMGSFLESLPAPKDGQPKHKIESVRFRSTAFASTGIPKKAAFATKNLMEATTKSTNAYVVYNTAYAAREAVRHLNAKVFRERHIRVDSVAHPAKTDHRRCVFVGNLGFVDDESMLDEGGEGQRKRSKIPSDIEEGLWRQFGKAGKVESVRVVRDEKTRVGKGFAYVQFEDANSVEAALLFHEKKYPPMLPRVLRVSRAKAIAKTALALQRTRPGTKIQKGGANNANNTPIYNPKLSSQQQSLEGRASKLLGKAGAAHVRRQESTQTPKMDIRPVVKTPEHIVMEGYRASASSGKPRDLKFNKVGKKKQGKPTNRGSKRGSEWKKKNLGKSVS